MKLGKLREKTFPVSIDFGDGDVVNLSMLPHKDGQAAAMALIKQFEDSDTAESAELMREKFCRTFTSWDLQDDDGNDIPLTSEGIAAADVPVTLLGTFLSRGYDEVANSKKPGRRR